jgi:hypothetical protein
MAIDSDDVFNVSPHKSSNDELINIKLAQWAKGECSNWIESYLAVRSVSNINDVNRSDRTEYALIFYWPEMQIIINSFLERESSASRVNILRALAHKSKPSGSSSRLISTNKGTLSLEANQPLGLLLILILAIADLEVDVLAGSNKKIDQAISDFKKCTVRLHEAIGPELSHLFNGASLQTAGYVNEYDEVISQVTSADDYDCSSIQLRTAIDSMIAKLYQFQQRSAQDILETYTDTLGAEGKKRRNPLYQSNNGKPSLKLYRIKRITYTLIEITDVDTVINTRGIYSLIAYLVGLSLSPEAENCDLLQANEVKKQVDSAIKHFQETPETEDI